MTTNLDRCRDVLYEAIDRLTANELVNTRQFIDLKDLVETYINQEETCHLN